MKIRALGKWTLTSGLVSAIGFGAYMAYQETSVIKNDPEQEMPPGREPKYYLPVAGALMASVVAIALL